MKKFLKGTFAIILVTVILVNVIWTQPLEAKAEPVDDYIYGILDVDYIKRYNVVKKYDIYFQRTEDMTGTNGREYYDSDIHTNEWYEDRRVMYCMEVNGAYPYGAKYESETLTLLESERLDKEGLANFVKNASYREYWSARNVSSIGAQIEAAQIAIWIITTENADEVGFPTDPTKWTGNLDKYTYEEVGGISEMIGTLLECYRDSNLDVCKADIQINKLETENVLEQGYHVLKYKVVTKNCYENVGLKFSYTKEGITYDGIYSGCEAWVNEDMVVGNSYTYNCPDGEAEVVIRVPDTKEYDGLKIHLSIASEVMDNSVENILYYKTNQKKDKKGDGNMVRVQEVMGGFVIARKNLPSSQGTYDVLVSKGVLTLYKTGEVLVDFREGSFIYEDRPISGVEFGIYSDEECSELIEVLETTEGKAISGELSQGTYYVKELKTLSGLLLDETIHTVNITGATVEELTPIINISNTRTRGRISINKLDEDSGIPLKGGEFNLIAEKDIYDYTGQKLLVKAGTVIERITTDSEGRAEFLSDVPDGTEYAIVETKAPYGYVLEDKHYEVNIDNGEEPVKNYTFTIENNRQQGNITIIKHGEVAQGENITLSDAVFGIYSDKDCSKLVETLVTNVDGVAVSKNMELGTYYVKELKAPKGYVADSKVHTVDLSHGNPREMVVKENIEVHNNIIKIRICKKDSTGIKSQLSGAKMHIEALDGTIIYEFTTGEVPQLIMGISPGKYYLVEDEAPYGFEVANKLLIEVLEIEEIQEYVITDKAKLGYIIYHYTESGSVMYVPNNAGDINSDYDGDKPITPDEPEVPDIPEEPEEPEKPEAPDVPDTGDKSGFLGYLVLCIASIVAIILARGSRKHIFTLCFLGTILIGTVSVEASEEKVIVIAGDVIYGEGGQEYEETIEKDGYTYELYDVVEESFAPITNRTQFVTKSLDFKGYSDIVWQESGLVANVYDPVNGVTKSQVLSPVNMEIKKTYWQQDFEFEIDVIIEGPYISVFDEIIIYDEKEPKLYPYREKMLESMGLDRERYVIESVEWIGEEYELDGKCHRIAMAKGSRRLNDYRVTYEGVVQLDDITTVKRYNAIYRLLVVNEVTTEATTEATTKATTKATTTASTTMATVAPSTSEKVTYKTEATTKPSGEPQTSSETFSEEMTSGTTAVYRAEGQSFDKVFSVILGIIIVLIVAIVILVCYNIINRKRKGVGSCRGKKH